LINPRFIGVRPDTPITVKSENEKQQYSHMLGADYEAKNGFACNSFEFTVTFK
jgi:hypothetical protein